MSEPMEFLSTFTSDQIEAAAKALFEWDVPNDEEHLDLRWTNLTIDSRNTWRDGAEAALSAAANQGFQGYLKKEGKHV